MRSGTRPSTTNASAGASAISAKPQLQPARSTSTAKTGAAMAPDAEEDRLLQAERGAAAAAAGGLGGGREREAVPARGDDARDDEHRQRAPAAARP